MEKPKNVDSLTGTSSQNKKTITIKQAVPKPSHQESPWTILVIDDEQGVLDVTLNVLKRFTYKGRGLEIKCAKTFKEGKELYDQFDTAAVALIDCVMDKNTSGLDFIQYIRKEKKNNIIQLVMRTGQPDFAPEREIILNYEINDYLAKTELTHTKLYHRMISYLRQYENIQKIEAQKKELLELNSVKDHILSVVSHELRSPINGIAGLISMILDEPEHLTPDLCQKLSLVQGSNERMLYLIKDLMDETMRREKKFRMDMAVANLYDIVESVQPSLELQIAYHAMDKDISLVNNIRRELPNVYVDANRIQQVIVNLVNNAIKYTKSGSITLSGEVRDNFLCVSVSDTGIGIAQENLAKIFDAFSQITPTQHYDGIGLGLSITNKIIDMHHGHLQVESELDKGSTFTFTLPLAN